MKLVQKQGESLLKFALPSVLSAPCGESIFRLVRERAKSEKFSLLLDASEVSAIEPDGLRWLYETSIFMKKQKMPKIIIRKPNRKVRDALILSNTLKTYDIREEEA